MLERDLADASVRELRDEVGDRLVDRGDVAVGECGPDQRRQDRLGYIYRLFATLPLDRFVQPLIRLAENPLAGQATRDALAYLEALFAAGSDALGSALAGRAEELVGDPDVVSASVAALAQDLLTTMRKDEQNQKPGSPGRSQP